MKPNDIIMAWNKESALSRIDGCECLLRIHGFLTEAESKRVQQRVLKWVEKHREGK